MTLVMGSVMLSAYLIDLIKESSAKNGSCCGGRGTRDLRRVGEHVNEGFLSTREQYQPALQYALRQVEYLSIIQSYMKVISLLPIQSIF